MRTCFHWMRGLSPWTATTSFSSSPCSSFSRHFYLLRSLMAITSPLQLFPQLKLSLTVAGYKFLITMSNLTIETLGPATIAILNGDSRGYVQIGPLGEEALCIHLRHIVPGGTYVLFYAEYNNEKLLMEMACSVYVNKKGLFDCNHIFHTSHRSDVLCRTN